MAAILVFFCLIASRPFWPRSRLNILLNFTFESEANGANLQGNKRILKWRSFWNKVHRKTLDSNDQNQVADQRFSLKQWFSAGAQSRGLRKPGCGRCY